MPKSYAIPECAAATRRELERRVRSQTAPRRVVERARIVLGCLAGEQMQDLAARLGIRPNTAIRWRCRFARKGLAGLADAPRPGKKLVYDAAFRARLLAKLGEPPPRGQAQWDGPSLAAELGASPHAVWRVLRKEGICLRRRRSWCVSTDPQFAAKASDIVGLYLAPPEQALVLCIGEKPSIQALERRQGFVKTADGKIVRAYKSTYRRHGTLNLFAALQVATGAVKTKITSQKRRLDFLAFMDELAAAFPEEDQQLHVILDNYRIHKKNDAWLARHPNVHFHYTPTSASWLNMVEIWFGILERKALRGGDFHGKDDLRQAIEDFVAAGSERAHPFVWRKREVRGSQIRNTVANICN